MVASPQKIVISGYYGFRNSGDEAVLQSILIALRKQGEIAGITIEPVVLSIDPEWTSATYGVKSVHRMKLGEVRAALKESAGLISGGGSLLQDVTSPKSVPYYLAVMKLAQWLGKPVFVYAQGIGPVRRPLFHSMIRSVFRKCEYISVRDEQSRQLLGTMGLPLSRIAVVPDPVMGLTLPEDQGTEGPGSTALGAAATEADAANVPVVGISVRYWEQDRRELDAIADGLLKACRKEPMHLRFLPFHLPSDVEASRYMIERIAEEAAGAGGSVSLAENVVHPQHMLREVGECSVLIGMRLHSLIYAAGRRVPLIGISYDPKIDHFLKRIGTLPVGATSSLRSDDVEDEVLRLLAGGRQWREDKEELIASLVHDAEAPARHIAEYLRHKG